jgi:Uncharacterised protein family UPF0547
VYLARLGLYGSRGLGGNKLNDQPQVVIKTYTGSQDWATALYRADSVKMAAQGYFPTSQTWAPGEWGCGAFLLAVLLCFVVIGIFAFIYMLLVPPAGTLSVTYELEKTCPKCAEQVKAAAKVCRFCGHEFTEVGLP